MHDKVMADDALSCDRTESCEKEEHCMFLDMKKKENRTISMETSPTCTSDVGLLANKNESKKSVKASVARKFRVVKVHAMHCYISALCCSLHLADGVPPTTTISHFSLSTNNSSHQTTQLPGKQASSTLSGPVTKSPIIGPVNAAARKEITIPVIPPSPAPYTNSSNYAAAAAVSMQADEQACTDEMFNFSQLFR
ncbi:hypothetical protein EB796_018563 [Bugula neritina]|uniref:Uncharacterized protein n=1 Tax=Bugula neritina TaxID=10212 RepID=A0A7J7JBY6_BUGNE|nr:hypothetical protein EB796_018563 [Bugula neritina]